MKVPFTKPYVKSNDLVNLLKSRGLIVNDSIRAQKFLDYIGYYRLSAYMYPFLQTPKTNHIFKPNVTFDNVLTIYSFDKKLRLLIFNELEKIEVAIRSVIISTVCELINDSFWITNPSNFVNATNFSNTILKIDNELQHSHEEFISHFQSTYSDVYPPAWILGEILTFGTIVNIYNNLKNKRIKKVIAQKFGLQTIPFQSWLTIITLTRNACCHHQRVWNKQNTIRPTLPSSTQFPWLTIPTDPLRIYFDLSIIKYFLNIISPQNDMRDKLLKLLSDFPNIDTAAMGFPKGWEKETLWR